MIDPTTAYPADRTDLANTSGVSWAAIFGGALGAAALSLILILLGAGLGFTAASPWADRGASAQALGISAILWLTLTQIVASGLGGYIAGRLRVRWANVHDDEVYFRDTAHGFLAWSVATLITASLVLGSVGSLVGSGVQAGAQVASGVVNAAGSAVSSAVSRSDGNSLEYYVDTLFRSNQAAPASDADMRGEALRIFTTGTLSGQGLDPADRQYLGQVIAQRTGMTQPEAERRVDETYARATQALQQAETKVKAAADSAKKVAAWSALWMFVALLCGAFVASLAATFGGKQRDQVHYTRSLA
ncbi:MAG: hypothetical protein ABWY06_18490 [Pseudomonas sp.]|jgi:hypothetical protein|uniref:hypothetical protein n=1 Tax=Pseudomonas sp. TaxID=306 RepID=UPI00339A19F5